MFGAEGLTDFANLFSGQTKKDFCDYAVGLCLLMAEWYRDKWSLFLRGFSRGQLDLFGSLQKTGTEA